MSFNPNEYLVPTHFEVTDCYIRWTLDVTQVLPL